MQSLIADDMLDNPIWHAINGPQRALAEVFGRAGRYLPDVSVFAGVAEDATWTDLGSLVGGGSAILLAPRVKVPDGWSTVLRIPCLQMLADTLNGEPFDESFVRLGPQDVPAMLELVNATQPGPFNPRTIEMGRYIGYRDEGRLVAMAGERIRCPGYTEVSAVCTVEGYRGRGLARRLVIDTVSSIRSRGDQAFLHVAADNSSAIALYVSLGFTVRTEAEAVVVVQA